jgi:hypothetical protein
MPLDAVSLDGLAFIKIDVEGSELPLLMGAQGTIERHRPVIFIELEERHAAGIVDRVSRMLLESHEYRTALFLKAGILLPFDRYDSHQDQLSLLPRIDDPNYVSNFVFLP